MESLTSLTVVQSEPISSDSMHLVNRRIVPISPVISQNVAGSGTMDNDPRSTRKATLYQTRTVQKMNPKPSPTCRSA